MAEVNIDIVGIFHNERTRKVRITGFIDVDNVKKNKLTIGRKKIIV